MPHEDNANNNAGCSGTAGYFVFGTILSSFALAMAISMAMPSDTTGQMVSIPPFLVALPIGAIVTAAVMLGCVIVHCRQEKMIAAVLVLPSLVVFVGGICGTAYFRHSDLDRFKRDMEAGAESGRIYRRFYLEVKENPEIALREKWYAASDERRRVYHDSMGDPTIPYSLPLLKRFYVEAPSTRTEIFANPACDAAFLAEHFEEAWNLARSDDDRMLICIVLNEHTPRDLIQKVAQAKDLPKLEGAAAWAREKLKTIRPSTRGN